MSPANLNDYQLYALVMNPSVDKELKEKVTAEFHKRDFSITQLDEFDIKLRAKQKDDSSLSSTEKLLIVLFPFVPLIQAIIANRHFKTGSRKKWSAHWNLMAIGYFFWLIVLLLLVWAVK